MKKKILINFYKKFIYGNKVTKKNIVRLLHEEKLVIADIGSTGGLDGRWFYLDGFIKKYSFDPDLRAENKNDEFEKVFNIGLWSSEANKEIFLTKFPSASSVFRPNMGILNRFLNHDCHEVVGRVEIKLASLDSIMGHEDNIDFIKVDTEGADLEIIRGASKTIKSTVIGIQAEAQFLERNQGSPMFSDLDPVIRSSGYWLMELKRQSWIRKNNINNIDAVPQLIWADAVYMITENEAIKRALHMEPSRRLGFLSKIILISIAYGYFDYAMEILESFFKNNLISTEEMKFIKSNIKGSMRSNAVILFRLFLALIVATFGYLIGELFGVKRDFFNYHLWFSYKRFFEGLTKLNSRHGPSRAAVGDGF